MNRGNLYAFQCVCRLAKIPALCNVEKKAFSFCMQDIDELTQLPVGATAIYSFWVGMPLPTQVRILWLSAACSSVTAIAVFRDSKWRSSSDVLRALLAVQCIVRSEPTPLSPPPSASTHLSPRRGMCGCRVRPARGSSSIRPVCR